MAAQPGSASIRLLMAGAVEPRVRAAFARRRHHVTVVPLAAAVEATDESVEAVLLAGGRDEALGITRRLKTRFQMPLLPIVALVSRAPRLPAQSISPDSWLLTSTRPSDVVVRVEELVRIRRAERELVRLNSALAELAAENGRLYDRARRDADATALLLRELQHRVRNNLASIQALLVLERHRAPARPLPEAIDVAIARLRSMAALQDSLSPNEERVRLATLAAAVLRGALDVFGAADRVRYQVTGDVQLPSRAGGALAIVLNELVTNALRHAEPTNVRVEIEPGPEELQVVVADDGRGFDGTGGSGSGLMIVRAVVRNELHGTLSFSNAATGTRVRIGIPAEPPD